MGIFRSLMGSICLELTSADIPGALIAIAEENIQLQNVQTLGPLTLRLEVCRKDWRAFSGICHRRGEKLRIIRNKGLYWTGKRILKRPVVILGIALILAGVLYLPGRVLFFRVEGNASVPGNRILEAAEVAGLRFGVNRRSIRSEVIKNAVLESVPQLQWVGVNTSGCVAIISVRERSEMPEQTPQVEGVSSIIADCDGVVISATVTRGTGLCGPGQAVLRGQVLISGYTDLGLTIRGEQAEGEIFALTRRDLRIFSPCQAGMKGLKEEEEQYISLLIGKNRINLWKDSGISDASCDRMYEEYYVTLPGGFTLPLALIKETVVSREIMAVEKEPSAADPQLTEFASEYLKAQMISGQIRSTEELFFDTDGFRILEGSYLCTEMIGRQRQEKIGEEYG